MLSFQAEIDNQTFLFDADVQMLISNKIHCTNSCYSFLLFLLNENGCKKPTPLTYINISGTKGCPIAGLCL